MLTVNGINNGIVIDHIPAGKGPRIFNKLFSEHVNSPVVLLMNVQSKTLGKKDIIKIENEYNFDLNLLGLIDKHITVNIIENDKLKEKIKVVVPEKIKGFIKCKNPRCISHTDDYAIPEFTLLSSNGTLKYSCSYCEEITEYKF
ncbi:aspartate carbamoyltransferase regulatory subunit [Clostridiaceae bacterium HSG29]|nr:aspartate carbamoyltransferase regulatory subunit [Clostridiaceae bacterium HSG29]